MGKNIEILDEISQKIYWIRGRRVMLDRDLAAMYGVETFNLNKSVKRNLDRFPDDFMFQLTEVEMNSLIFQIGISKEGRGGTRFLPYAFTQEGIAMLSGVLRSKQAINVNIAIMRTFVKMREFLETNKELAKRVNELESKYDGQFKVVFDAIRSLILVGSARPQKKIKTLSEK